MGEHFMSEQEPVVSKRAVEIRCKTQQVSRNGLRRVAGCFSALVNVTVEDEWGELPPIKFNDDGTITDTQLVLVNLKTDHQWVQV